PDRLFSSSSSPASFGGGFQGLFRKLRGHFVPRVHLHADAVNPFAADPKVAPVLDDLADDAGEPVKDTNPVADTKTGRHGLHGRRGLVHWVNSCHQGTVPVLLTMWERMISS